MRRFTVTIASLALLATGFGITATAAQATPVASAAKKAAKKPAVTLTAKKDVIELGKKVKLKGTVKPKKGTKGDIVVIKQRLDGKKKWKVEGRTKVNKKGKFTYTEKPTTPNARDYKAVLKKTKKHPKATSAKVTVAVGQWLGMKDLTKQVAASESMSWRGSTTVDGTGYDNSIATYRFEGPHTGWLELNLYKKCYTMATDVGLGDNSETGSGARVAVINDGTEVYQNTLDELFSTTPVSVPLAGVQRVRFEVDVTTETRTVAGFLAPEFLCTD